MLVLFILSALVYGAASFAYGADSDGQGIRRYARLLLVTAAALHFALIGAQCVEGNHPFRTIFLMTSFGSLLAVTGYVGLARSGRLDALGAAMAPVGLIGLVLGVVFTGQGHPVEESTLIARAHIGLASAGLAGLMLAAAVAGLYLAMERKLRNKVFRPGQGGMSLAGLDRLHHRLVLLVAPVFTLAIVTGVIWILSSGGPERLAGRTFEIVAAGAAWLATMVLLVSRAMWGTRGRRSALLTLTAFLAMILIVVWYGIRV